MGEHTVHVCRAMGWCDIAESYHRFVERALLAVQRDILRMLGSVFWSQKDIAAELERISVDLGEYLSEKTVRPVLITSLSPHFGWCRIWSLRNVSRSFLSTLKLRSEERTLISSSRSAAACADCSLITYTGFDRPYSLTFSLKGRNA